MSDMWRPKGWENPNEKYHNISDIQSVQDAEYEAFEAGADAIIEAMTKDAAHYLAAIRGGKLMVTMPSICDPERTELVHGYLVFVPEAKE